MDCVHPASNICIFFVCGERSTLFVGRPDVASVEGRGWQTAGLGSGADASGVGAWVEGREKQQQQVGVIFATPDTAKEKKDLGGSFCFGNRAMQAGEAEVDWVLQPRKLAMGVCGDLELPRFSGGNGGCRCLRQATLLRSVPVSGVTNLNVMSLHKQGGQCQS